MPLKIDQEYYDKKKQEFEEKSRLIFGDIFDYSLVVMTIGYNGKVRLRCVRHKSVFEQYAKHHLKGYTGCNECGTEEFIRKAILVHGSRFDYGSLIYLGTYNKIIIICRKHGSFEQLPRNHLKGQGCNKCENENRTYSTEEFILASIKVHGLTYEYLNAVYVGSLNKIAVTCRIHGDFLVQASKHLEGSGCKKCAYERKKYTTDEYIEAAGIVHNGKYTYPRTVYSFAEGIVIITCPTHGDFGQQAYVHMHGSGCPKCVSSISKQETKWLDHLNVPQEYRQKALYIGSKKYMVDAYDPNTNTVFEFNGDFWHGNPECFNHNDRNHMNNKTFGDLHKATLEKEAHLISCGYNVVSIWEKDFERLLRNSSNAT